MNKYYIILPVIMMAFFAWAYSGSQKEARIKEEAKKVVEDQKKAEEAAKKEELAKKAQADAEKRTQERIKEEKEREDKRVAKYEDAINRIKEDIDRYNRDIDEANETSARLRKEIADMRARREKEGRETFDLMKRVELARIRRRNAELEIQRFTEMIAKKAAASAMAQIPVVAAAPTKK